MCGIAGLIHPDPSQVVQALERMNRSQTHRGPDDCGVSSLPFDGATLGLAQTRLSIIDVSACGHQPMVHPQTGDQLIFNGEIYNFQELRRELEQQGSHFIGHSDTEVLLHALTRWGPDCIRRLHGMFAFAFYNARRNSLLLARDSVGIKPLYVAQTAEMFLFASELRAILATGLIPAKVDRAGMASLLAYGAVQAPRTMIQDVHSFPAGHYQLIHPGNKIEPPVRYWNFPALLSYSNENELLLHLRQDVSHAVRDHLVADVPVGVFLSSGIDSTVIAAMAMHHAARLRSFTVGFVDQPDLSESPVAKATGDWLWLDHTDIQVSGAEAFDWSAGWLNSMDQPSVDGLNVYVISKVVRQAGITVALSGQGGDELFGGYPSFRDVPRLQQMLTYLKMAPRALRKTLARALTLRSSEAVQKKMSDILASDASIIALLMHRRRAMANSQMQALGLDHAALGLTPYYVAPEALDDVLLTGDVLADVSRLETVFYQGNMLLRDSDVNGMAHSLEIRVPILDQRLLNLAHSIPGSMRLPDGNPNKHLLRSAFVAEFRPGLLSQKKRGFTLPIRRWMIGPMRDMCEQSITALKNLDILNPQGVDGVWNSFVRAPESPIWTRAFTLCVLGNWLKTRNVAA